MRQPYASDTWTGWLLRSFKAREPHPIEDSLADLKWFLIGQLVWTILSAPVWFALILSFCWLVWWRR